MADKLEDLKFANLPPEGARGAMNVQVDNQSPQDTHQSPGVPSAFVNEAFMGDDDATASNCSPASLPADGDQRRASSSTSSMTSGNHDANANTLPGNIPGRATSLANAENGVPPRSQLMEEISLDDIPGDRSPNQTSRPGIVSSIVHISKADDHHKQSLQSDTKATHRPNEMFVELDELFLEDQVWQEKARWIKYEEDMESGGGRWGKPHVASLSFHSLLELKQHLEHGVVLLDLQATDFPQIASIVVDELITAHQLDPHDKGKILHALLLKHRHVGNDTNLLNKLPELNQCFTGSTESGEKETGNKQNGLKFNMNVKSIAASVFQRSKSSRSLSNGISHQKTSAPRMGRRQSESNNIIRRIPEGAEATTVLVGSMDFLKKPIMAFVRLAEGRQLGNLTEVPLPVRFMFILLGPAEDNMQYYEIGRSISTLMANMEFHEVAYQAAGRKDLLDAVNGFLNSSIVLPPGDFDKKTLLPIMDITRNLISKDQDDSDDDDAADDALQRTKRLFGGLVNDVKKRYPWYLSDIKDGINFQCLATFFFIFFAALSPAITFGGLLGSKTDKWMGVSELLIITCVGGVVMSLFAGQPLVIAGFTGPLLIFEEALYSICELAGLEYLPFRAWIAMWVTVIAIIFVMLEGSVFVRYITRFLEEIFSLLISLIFIYEVFYKLYMIFKAHPLMDYYPRSKARENLGSLGNDTDYNTTTAMPYDYTTYNTTTDAGDVLGVGVGYVEVSSQPNTALLCLILTMGTFLIALFLKEFRNSTFLGRPVRRALGDFGVPIAIIIMVLLDFAVHETYTEKLDVPDGLTPTAPQKRGWFINPLGINTTLPIWAYFAAIIPALLVSILIFMETLITSLIINKKDRNLKKGSGYHLDIFLIGLLSTVSGLFGMPMLTVATVRSVTHVSALSVFSRTHAPGEPAKLVEVKEQRVTGLTVHIMIGVAVLMGPVLRQVPLAVLFGVFLYMGVSSTSGLQFFERIKLLFMPIKHHPDVSYVKRVRTAKMHVFTLIQIFCLAVLWVIKSTEAALAFPFFILLLIPVRLKLLGYIFTPKELQFLDQSGKAPKQDKDEDEPDFYQQAHIAV